MRSPPKQHVSLLDPSNKLQMQLRIHSQRRQQKAYCDSSGFLTNATTAFLMVLPPYCSIMTGPAPTVWKGSKRLTECAQFA
eukprot:1715577-Amphidinium_carterae.3